MLPFQRININLSFVKKNGEIGRQILVFIGAQRSFMAVHKRPQGRYQTKVSGTQGQVPYFLYSPVFNIKSFL